MSWKINSTHHSLAQFQKWLAAREWLNHLSCLHDWQTNVAMQSALPLCPHGFWCTCTTFPKIWVANFVFSSMSPACFKQSSTEVEFWLWISARNSFMWLLSVIYEWQHRPGVKDTSTVKKRREEEAGVVVGGCGRVDSVSFQALR